MIGKEEFWSDVKNELSKTMQTISYDIWIEPLEPVCFMDNVFVLAANTSMSKKTIERCYLDQIRDVVNSLNSFVTDVEIIVKDQEPEYREKQSVSLPNKGLIVDEKSSEKHARNSSSPFLEKYTFDTFVQGRSNEYALAAAKTVAENLGGRYNPLFIYSGVGLGKTHLLHAIGNYLRVNSPKTKVVYANSETMINELIGVIRAKNNEESNRFREKYRACDVLMIDDIQFLKGKDSMQEAFFHIFNDLYQANKQIIITSDKSPKDLPDLEERLRTRFSWGLSVDIQPPDMETRIAILKMKASHEKFMLSDEVAEFIAETSTTNIRDMEGLLNRIIFFSSLANKVINTKELAYDALQDFIEEKKEALDAGGLDALFEGPADLSLPDGQYIVRPGLEHFSTMTIVLDALLVEQGRDGPWPFISGLFVQLLTRSEAFSMLRFQDSLKAMADKKRLDILAALREAPRSSGELAAITGLSAATVTHHMQILLNARLVGFELRGARSIYSLNREGAEQLSLDLRGFLGV